ncbi:MAG: PaaI family thioesterase [bacterium]
MDELCDFIGLRFVDAGTTELEIAPRHINPAGVLSGVVTYALVDYGMGRALWEVKEADETVVTVSLSLNYVGSAEGGRIICRTALDRKTAGVALLQSEVRHEDGRLLALGLGTFAVIRGPG